VIIFQPIQTPLIQLDVHLVIDLVHFVNKIIAGFVQKISVARIHASKIHIALQSLQLLWITLAVVFIRE